MLDVAYGLMSVTQDLLELKFALGGMDPDPTVAGWCGVQAGRIQRAVDGLVRAALIHRAHRGRDAGGVPTPATVADRAGEGCGERPEPKPCARGRGGRS